MLRPVEGLDFDERQHVYSIGGIVVPSVTQIMRPMSSQAYFSVDKDVLARAASRGTDIHLAAELYAMMGCKEAAPEIEPYFNSWLAWYEDVKPEFLALEYRFYHPVMWYAGTVDAIAKIGGHVLLIDYKSTAVLNLGAVTVQASAYEKGLREQGVEVEQRYVLHIRPDGYRRVRDFRRLDDAFDVFLACMKIQNFIKKTEGK